jgi:hypothetical protein
LGLPDGDSRTQSGNRVKIAGISSRWIDDLGNSEIHRVADTRDIGTKRRKMRVGQSDADDERRRWSDAFQIVYVEV